MIGLLGGTGPLGRGLALRLGLAGHPVLIGSRAIGKATEAVGKVAAKTDRELDVRPVSNETAAREGDVVFITVPYAAQRATLSDVGAHLAGKLVVSCVNALAFDRHGPQPVLVDEGSAAQEAQALLPDSTVVGAFQNVSAVSLLEAAADVDADVLIVSDVDEAREQVADLVEQIPGMRPVIAGPLRLARPVEEMTAVLIAVNKRYEAHASLRITGL